MDHILKIPDDVWRYALMETSDPDGYSESSTIYNGDNNVSIKKIIGSKAVFDVDCEDEHCWFVYNTAALKGWSAFSGSNQLPIHKANMGFVGVKLRKGKHFLWMDYRPVSTDIGLIVTFTGWLFVLVGILSQRAKRDYKFRGFVEISTIFNSPIKQGNLPAEPYG